MAKKSPAKKPAPKKPAPKKPAPKKAGKSNLPQAGNGATRQQFVTKPLFDKNAKLSPFLAKQKQRLLQLKDTLLDSMSGVARGNLHAGSETSAFGMHQADAGSDAYDRDFALSILSQEQNSLYEIDDALKRIHDGSYGKCEVCNKPIPHIRLEARPFTRYTVDCQEELEKRQHRHNARLPINSLFGLTEEESESEEEETTEKE
jgi:DnaK suppressor protein